MLSKLEEKAMRLAKELQDVHNQIDRERLDYIKKTYGLAFGSIVKVNGDKYLVSAINPSTDPPYLKGKPLKKDGTFSKVNRYIGNTFKVLLF